MPVPETRFAPRHRMMLAAGVAAVSCALFMVLNLTGNLDYVLNRRALMLATLVLVGIASATATILFQTVTGNRILTPSVMGFEALFILIQTLLAFFWAARLVDGWPPLVKFAVEAGAMTAFASLLYRWLFATRRGDLMVMLLVGLVFGILFNGLSDLMQRLIAPAEFDILRGRLFARLTLPSEQLILAALLLITASCSWIWHRRHMLDVLALGPDAATGLGVDYRSAVTRTLMLVAVLVSTATALIGPLTFLGFTAATLAYALCGSHRHGATLPMASLLAISFLAGGQMILEHGLDMAGALSVVIEFVGGSLFLLLLLRKGRI